LISKGEYILNLRIEHTKSNPIHLKANIQSILITQQPVEPDEDRIASLKMLGYDAGSRGDLNRMLNNIFKKVTIQSRQGSERAIDQIENSSTSIMSIDFEDKKVGLCDNSVD
jgi:hypothetical protein